MYDSQSNFPRDTLVSTTKRSEDDQLLTSFYPNDYESLMETNKDELKIPIKTRKKEGDNDIFENKLKQYQSLKRFASSSVVSRNSHSGSASQEINIKNNNLPVKSDSDNLMKFRQKHFLSEKSDKTTLKGKGKDKRKISTIKGGIKKRTLQNALSKNKKISTLPVSSSGSTESFDIDLLNSLIASPSTIPLLKKTGLRTAGTATTIASDISDKGDIAKNILSPTICKFWMEGQCRKKDACPFSHDIVPNRLVEDVQKSQICKFLLKNSCYKGSSCPFSHDLSLVPCRFFHVYKNCSMGANCRFSHDLISEEETHKLLEQCNMLEIPNSSPSSSKEVTFSHSSSTELPFNFEQSHPPIPNYDPFLNTL